MLRTIVFNYCQSFWSSCWEGTKKTLLETIQGILDYALASFFQFSKYCVVKKKEVNIFPQVSRMHDNSKKDLKETVRKSQSIDAKTKTYYRSKKSINQKIFC